MARSGAGGHGPALRCPFLSCIFAICLFYGNPSYAQARARRTVLSLVVAPSFDDFRSHAIPGGTLDIGVAASIQSDRAAIEFGVNVPRWHESRSPYRYQRGGHYYEEMLTVRHRSVDVYAQYGRTLLVTRTATVAYFAGGAFVYRPDESITVTNEILPDGTLMSVQASEYRSTRNYKAGIGGIDLALRLSNRLSVRPRLRIVAFPSLLDDSGAAPKFVIVRPELAFGWIF